jgi:hypothetical protein
MAERNGEPQAVRAREAYLDGLPAEKQAEVIRRAERGGPSPEDADWIIARAAQEAADAISTSSTEAAARIMAAAAAVEQGQSAAPLAPEALAAIEAVVAKGAAPTEQLREMASDLRAIRTRVWSAQAKSRWLMFGVFVAGLVVAFVCAVLLHFAGHRPSGQIWIAADGLARLAEVLACVITLAAGVTWWATRR